MFHEPPSNFIYSAYRIDLIFEDDIKTPKKCSATGFVLDISGTPYIVTNRHVIDLDYQQATPKYKKFKLVDFQITGRRADDSTYTFKLHPDAPFFTHTNKKNDVVLIEARIFSDNPEFGSGFFWHFGLEHLANSEIYSNSIFPFDLVCYSGFPDQHDKLGNRPILRSGHIASDPKFNYSWDCAEHGQCVAYDGFSFSGASGSPVFSPPRGMSNIPNSRHGYLIGVNAGHVSTSQNQHSGISYFYKSLVILEIIDENGLCKS